MQIERSEMLEKLIVIKDGLTVCRLCLQLKTYFIRFEGDYQDIMCYDCGENMDYFCPDYKCICCKSEKSVFCDYCFGCIPRDSYESLEDYEWETKLD